MLMTKADFVNYLTNTLIPDLRLSGNYTTAVDFKAAVLFMQGAKAVEIGDDVEVAPASETAKELLAILEKTDGTS